MQAGNPSLEHGDTIYLTVADRPGYDYAKVTNLNGFGGATNVTHARSIFDPQAQTTRVTLNGTADANYSRKWTQKISDTGGTDVIKNTAKMDVDFALVDPTTHSISQTVTVQNDSTLTLSYEITDGRQTYATGTVSMTASATASGGYNEGPIIVDDDDD